MRLGLPALDVFNISIKGLQDKMELHCLSCFNFNSKSQGLVNPSYVVTGYHLNHHPVKD
jgi:hypothetical protein